MTVGNAFSLPSLFVVSVLLLVSPSEKVPPAGSKVMVNDVTGLVAEPSSPSTTCAPSSFLLISPTICSGVKLFIPDTLFLIFSIVLLSTLISGPFGLPVTVFNVISGNVVTPVPTPYSIPLSTVVFATSASAPLTRIELYTPLVTVTLSSLLFSMQYSCTPYLQFSASTVTFFRVKLSAPDCGVPPAGSPVACATIRAPAGFSAVAFPV